MKKIKLRFLFPLFLFGIVFLSGRAPVSAQENLLRNPGFEGNYFAWNGIGELQVAHEWTPWWVEDVNREPRWHRPEWKRANGSIFPYRVRSGGASQQWFTFYASHYAGMYQQVFNVTPGQTYRFSVWVQVWSSLEDNAFESVSPANPHLQIGIEPNGVVHPGLAWPPGSVLWSFEAPMDQAIDGWALMSVEAVAQSQTIAVYLRTNPDFANKHNDIYIDDAQLIAVSAAPPPAPTATPVPAVQPTAPPPTAVPPTAVPPTSVPPAATATPEPTATATAEPTATPTATATDTPSPTATATAPPPTATDDPPTATPEPTAEPTAVPTDTPQAVAEAGGAAVAGEADQPAQPADDSAGQSPAADPFPWWWWVLILPIIGALAWWTIGRRANQD